MDREMIDTRKESWVMEGIDDFLEIQIDGWWVKGEADDCIVEANLFSGRLDHNL